MKSHTVLLVANYPPDRQRSMALYAQLLREWVCQGNGVTVDIITPPVLFSKLSRFIRPLDKWLGYIDKYIMFPPLLWWIARKYDLIHICDHSNAVYCPWTSKTPCLVTCHDMLAVRAGLGDTTTFCEASLIGGFLQRWILESLARAPYIAFVSHFTLSDYLRLTQRTIGPDLRVILNPLNAPFSSQLEQDQLRASYPDLIDTPFLLMVGSSLPRKNREAAISLMSYLNSEWKGLLVIAGAPLTKAQLTLASSLSVSTRIINVIAPNHNLLNALYRHAHALLFPSFSEGFGWPVIEAQQCDCPVICSNVTAVPEVAGKGAYLCSPDDIQAMASAVKLLEDPLHRTRMIAAGRDNLARFEVSHFRRSYLQFYHYIWS